MNATTSSNNASHDLADEIHTGLYRAWHLRFEATGTPYSDIKPEYVATVMVGDHICRNYFPRHKPSLRLHFEHLVHDICRDCFKWLPPRQKDKIPARMAGSNGSREKVDIAIYDERSGVGNAIHVIELKVSELDNGLQADLQRNKALMELQHKDAPNGLRSALLGVVIVDDKAVGEDGQAESIASRQSAYEALADGFPSNVYTSHVTVKPVTHAPDPDEVGGEFRLIMSVVIEFRRKVV